MNWYKTSRVNPADLAARQIAREVFQEIKAGKDDFLFTTNVPGVDVVMGYLDNRTPRSKDNPIAVAAAYTIHTEESQFANHIGITIYAPPDFGPKYYSQLYPKLQSAIRHELEHSTQPLEQITEEGGKAWQYSRPTPEAAEKYITSPLEIAAHVAGMYYQAKKTRVPFIDILDNWIASWKGYYEEHDPDTVTTTFDHIREKLLDYARQRYPKALL